MEGYCYCKRRFTAGKSTSSLNHSPKLEVSAFGSRDFSTPLNATVARDLDRYSNQISRWTWTSTCLLTKHKQVELYFFRCKADYQMPDIFQRKNKKKNANQMTSPTVPPTDHAILLYHEAQCCRPTVQTRSLERSVGPLTHVVSFWPRTQIIATLTYR